MNFRSVFGALCICILALSCKSREFNASEASSSSATGEKRTVKVGQIFVVSLENPTFYKWYVAKIDASILTFKGEKFIPPTSSAMGAPGAVELTFEALKAGETSVMLELKRSRDSKPEEVKTLKIDIKSNSSRASADSIDVKCEPPSGFAGNAGSVSGRLNLTAHPVYPAPAKTAKGELSVLIGGSTMVPVLERKAQFLGQYDDVEEEKYVHVGDPVNQDIAVYINFSRKDKSYIEYKENRYSMNCVP